MSDLSKFKIELEQTCDIYAWQPTRNQLVLIANQLVIVQPASYLEAQSIILSICPDITFSLFEGVDNSDIRTLLALAIQVANTKSP